MSETRESLSGIRRSRTRIVSTGGVKTIARTRPRIDKIKREIRSLPKRDISVLRQWFAELDHQKWDREIARDSISGRLNFLVEEARAEKADGKLGRL